MNGLIINSVIFFRSPFDKLRANGKILNSTALTAVNPLSLSNQLQSWRQRLAEYPLLVGFVQFLHFPDHA